MEEERKNLQYRLGINSIAIHATALLFGIAAFYLSGPLTAVIVFSATVVSLLVIVYWRTASNFLEDDKDG